MAPIKASQQSEIILFSILIFFFLLLAVSINFSKFNDFPTSKHFFLFTNDANFLSKMPSFSSGYISKSFLDITNPKTRSPKNSSFSLL